MYCKAIQSWCRVVCYPSFAQEYYIELQKERFRINEITNSMAIICDNINTGSGIDRAWTVDRK